MNSQLLIQLGQIAGIGGIALGVLLYVFKEILSNAFLKALRLPANQVFVIIQSLMIFTFGIAAVGIMAWLLGEYAQPVTSLQLRLLSFLIVVVLALATAIALQGTKHPIRYPFLLPLFVLGLAAPIIYFGTNEDKLCGDADVESAQDILSKLTDENIHDYVQGCYSKAGFKVDGAVSKGVEDRLAQWRDQSQSKHTFSYRTLEKELARVVKTLELDKQGLHPELSSELGVRENRVAECLNQRVKNLLGDALVCGR